jgi:putative ABC transport system permease protein
MNFLRTFNLRHLRKAPIRTGVNVLAIACGVSLAVGVLIVMISLRTSIAGVGEGLAGPAPIRVIGPHTHGALPGALVDTIADHPGVAAAVPVVQTVANAEGDGASATILALGVDCTVEALVDDFGCDSDAVATASAKDAPFVSEKLLRELGGNAGIRTDLGVIPLEAAPTLEQLDEINGGNVAIFPLPQAQAVFVRPDAVDAIYVTLEDGAKPDVVRRDLATLLGDHVQIQDADDPLPGADDAGFLLPLLGLLGVVTLTVGALLVYNVTRLSMEERRKDFAIASAIGAPGRTLKTGMMIESGLSGLVGGALGLVVGVGIAEPMIRAISRDLERRAGIVVESHLTWFVAVASVAAGTVVAVAATWGAARRASRIDIVEELYPSGIAASGGQRMSMLGAVARTVVGLAGIALGWAAQRNGGLSDHAPTMSYVSVVVASGGLVAAAAAWTPLIVRVAARQVGENPRASTLRLALGNLSSNPRQTTAMAVALATAVALGCGLGNFVPANRAGVSDAYGSLADGRLFVSTLPVANSALIDSKASAASLNAIERIPGVASVDRSYYVYTDTPASTFSVSAHERLSHAFKVHRGDPPEVVLDRGEAMIGPALARAEDLKIGSDLAIPTPNGYETVRVGGIWATPSDSGRSATVSPALHRELFGVQPAVSAFVRPTPGTSDGLLRDRIADASAGSGIRVRTAEQYTSELAVDVERFLDPFWTLQRLILLVALIATTATMLLAGSQRAREMGVLSAVGLSPRGLQSLTLTEGAVLGLVASAAGVIASIGITATLTAVAGVLFGLQPPLSFDARAAAIYAAIGVATVIAGSIWPSQVSRRTPILEALRYE